MTEISLDLVKKLREETAVSIMQCKKALEEAEGDYDKAKIALTKKAGEIAAKKGDRELGAGVIVVKKKEGEAVIAEVACETDFVANNEDFKAMAEDLVERIMNENLEIDSEEVKNALFEATQKFGERVELVRLERISGNVGFYVHGNNSVGAVVAFEKDVSDELAKDVAMHIAAQNPKYLTTEDIDEAERKKTEETLREEVADKPAEMQDKILEGKMNSFFKERVLSTQSFIKNPELTVEKLVSDAGNKVVAFVRMGVGEA